MLHPIADRKIIANISSYCDDRLVPTMGTKIKAFLLSLIEKRQLPPTIDGRFNWSLVSKESGVEHARLMSNRDAIRNVFYVINGHFDDFEAIPNTQSRHDPICIRMAGEICDEIESLQAIIRDTVSRVQMLTNRLITINDGKWPSFIESIESDDHVEIANCNSTERHETLEPFSARLSEFLSCAGATIKDVIALLSPKYGRINDKLIRDWVNGSTIPATNRSMRIISSIEAEYGGAEYCLLAYINTYSSKSYCLTKYFSKKRERDFVISHIPDDFLIRSEPDRQEIVQWLKNNILFGTTEYRRYVGRASSIPFRIKLDEDPCELIEASTNMAPPSAAIAPQAPSEFSATPSTVTPPRRLKGEFDDLIAYKTSDIPHGRVPRRSTWNENTATIVRINFGMMFGALHASPADPIRGCGVPLHKLSLALLAFPGFWEWYLRWRKERRGSFSSAELIVLQYARGWLRKESGWIYENPQLIQGIEPIEDLRNNKILISEAEIAKARLGWKKQCSAMFKRLGELIASVKEKSQKHRDPFEPVRVVLQSDEPMRQYRRIADEILNRPINADASKFAVAEKVRSYLMIRVSCHIGARSKNLRELHFCPRDERPRSLQELSILKRGELRWSREENGWEVLIPKTAFKNGKSKYFKNGPYRKILAYCPILYDLIEKYINIHRPDLLSGRVDPGTFFVKSPYKGARNASYSEKSFYANWATIIRNYGVYNPFTKRGAIQGILPHGPHAIRDVRATHVLKATGSYEQAAYAIQDDKAMVEDHYSEFGPDDREKVVARVLDPMWELMAA